MGFVVEGLNDEKHLKEVMPDAHCVVTNGTRMNGRVQMDINHALSLCDEVYLLTDPDEAGDTLAKMVWRLYPSLPRVLLDRYECTTYRNLKLKVGVEHCELEYLRHVLFEYLNNLDLSL
jgi:ribonuclease M5